MAAKTKKAPFLQRIRLSDLESELEQIPNSADRTGGGSHDAIDVTRGTSNETTRSISNEPVAGDWSKADFPTWYQDKVGDDPDDDTSTTTTESETTSYALELAAVQTLDQLNFGPVTVLAGDNGAGKSTVIEAIAVAAGFNPEGGSRNLNFSTHHTHSDLANQLTLEWSRHPRWGWFLRAETFYGMATHIEADEFLAPTFPAFHHRSHGESFLDLASHRLTGTGLYLLDEPESALSIQGLMSLCTIVTESLAKGSQFIISTHSPLLMAFPDASVFELDADTGMNPTTFASLASTALWQRFFENPAEFYQSIVGQDPNKPPR